jgi:CubicO group peptidase (beta-lactamase class C family)
MTSHFETTMQTAIETGVLASASVLAATKDRGLVYSKSFGQRSLEKGVESGQLQVNDIMTLASASKLITSITALQIVERGLVGVDDDLGLVLPGLGALKVLREVNGEVVLEERTQKITLRYVASSGIDSTIVNYN